MLLITLLTCLLSGPTPKAFTYTADPSKIAFYYTDPEGLRYADISILHEHDPQLRFATEAQMYGDHFSALGLYVENGRVISKLSVCRHKTSDNFGQSQGIFAITKAGKAKIVPVSQCNVSEYKYAVEVAPMVVINGKINPKLTKSKSIDFRAGYGILPDGKVLFVITQDAITFQQFAQMFVDKGCTTAAYIDGGYDNFYWTPTHPSRCCFGVMVGVRA